MRRVTFVFVLFVVMSFCFVDAHKAEVLFIDDMGSFSGAVLRVKDSANGLEGDKIYPSESMIDAGFLKFNVESTLPEVYFSIIVINLGSVVNTFSEGPFLLNGSQIKIDKREGVNEIIQKENITGEIVEENNNSVENVVEENNNSVENVVEIVPLSSWKLYFFYGLGGVFTFIVLMVMWFNFHNFRGWLTRINYITEDGELARLEAEIKKKDRLINLIKEKKKKKKKIDSARKKLDEENRKLEKMVKKKIKGK